jgi:hypothetical protein
MSERTASGIDSCCVASSAYNPKAISRSPSSSAILLSSPQFTHFIVAHTMTSSAVWSALGSPTKILAPMTGASDLAYRLLCRQQGAKLCFTPMMYACHFADSEKYVCGL